MASTLLEVTRASHEDVERLERLIVKDLQQGPATNKDRLIQSHRVRNVIETIMATTERLVEIYEDKDNARKDEIAGLGGSGNNVLSAFYNRLKEIHEYHRKHPDALVGEHIEAQEPVVDFTGEEAFGKHLDLHQLYNQYINSKFGEPIDYASYLDIFSQPHDIPGKLKLTRQYREYVENLLEYLIYFFQQTQPLQDLDRIFSQVSEAEWADGEVNGNIVPAHHTVIDLDNYSTVEQLTKMGPEKLKEALAALGLKSGGTVQQRAERLFLTKLIPFEKLDKKHFAKGSRGYEKIAVMEAKIRKLCGLLDETIARTKENVIKKQGLTYDEMEVEREEEETEGDIESNDDKQQMYNPLKLPLGIDGKPIPYWLYKLHGLGQKFKCEICGNASYQGRRAYERHFKEVRHQQGMRCLGIANTNNFNEIISIQDVKQLWEQIQERLGHNNWRPDLEEYEDRQGNIYNKKTYNDLQRQGLI